MKKTFYIFIINILIFISSIFIIELIIWEIEYKRLPQINIEHRNKIKFHSGIKNFTFDPKYFPTPENNWGRAPEGLEFKSKPIVFFGCSYTYGMNLRKEATLPYKFAYLAKRPTYNRALNGWGVQHMLYQSKIPEVYMQIPEPEYVIYVHMHDHPRRLYILTFDQGHMLNEDFYLRYKEKNGKLIQIKNKNIILNQIKRLYVVNELHHFYVTHFILRPSNMKNVFDFELKHFIESKKEMQKHWQNTKFVVYFYDRMYEDYRLINSLKKNGFIVINYYDLTNQDLNGTRYMQTNWHPTEAAWDLLTPLIIEKLNLKD